MSDHDIRQTATDEARATQSAWTSVSNPRRTRV